VKVEEDKNEDPDGLTSLAVSSSELCSFEGGVR